MNQTVSFAAIVALAFFQVSSTPAQAQPPADRSTCRPGSTRRASASSWGRVSVTSALLVFLAGLENTAHAQQNGAPVTLFNNVRVFDGKSASLSQPTNVLVRGNLIEKISQTPIPVDRSATTRIIEGGGRIRPTYFREFIYKNPASGFGYQRSLYVCARKGF